MLYRHTTFCITVVIVEFTQSVFSVFENELEMIVALKVRHPALTKFSVTVVASPDTADGTYFIIMLVTFSPTSILASDFAISNTTVTFGPTDTQVMFGINILNDNDLEPTEHFNLILTIPDISRRLGVVKGPENFATGRIMNDDGNSTNTKII